MSFNDLEKPELLKAVDFFGVEVDTNSDEEAIVRALEADGITYAQYEKFLVPDEEKQAAAQPKAPAKRGRKPAAVAEKKKVLVKMERKNPIYEIGKYRFTRSHPFQLVDEDDVDKVVRRHKGFSIATPSEAKEFYS